jgi:multidrug transporter EmrE-like cation transporter
MPTHDPAPTDPDRFTQARAQFKTLMVWTVVAAIAAASLALLYLKSQGGPMPLSVILATVAGVGFSVLLGAGLMGLIFFSNSSGHDEAATGKESDDDRSQG